MKKYLLVVNALDFAFILFVALAVVFPSYLGFLTYVVAVVFIAGIAKTLSHALRGKPLYSLHMLSQIGLITLYPVPYILRDIVIYSLHLMLYSFNGNLLYLASILACIGYELLIYNGAFNPITQRYIANHLSNDTEGLDQLKSKE